MKIEIKVKKKYILVLFSLIVFISILVLVNATDVDTSRPWHPVQQIAKSAADCYAIDENSDGIIDRADALLDGPDPDPVQYVDTNSPWHPLQQISKGSGSSESIDDDENGWPDVCESLTEPGTTTAVGAVFHPIFQISRSSSNMQSVDSNKNGWPDKCDCVLSELNTDENNCGSCGYVCTGGQTCFDSECCTPVDGVWSGWSHTNGYDDGAGGTCSEPCGGGTQSRTCTNPAPYCDGANCVGDSTQDCNIQPCCQTGYSYSEPYTFWYVFDTGHGKVWWSGSNLGSHGGSSSIVVGSYEYFPGDWRYRWGVSPNGPGSYIDYYEVRRCLLR